MTSTCDIQRTLVKKSVWFGRCSDVCPSDKEEGTHPLFSTNKEELIAAEAAAAAAAVSQRLSSSSTPFSFFLRESPEMLLSPLSL